MSRGKWVKEDSEKVVNEMTELLENQKEKELKVIEVNKDTYKPKKDATVIGREILTFYDQGIPKKYIKKGNRLFPLKEDK